MYTIQEVIDEVTCKRQLRHLSVLSYDLIIKDVFVDNIKFVTEFSKKTGDYPSLSAIDIKVVALAYQLEKEHVGDSHLNTVPKIQKDISVYKSKPDESKHAMGFFIPIEKKSETDAEKTPVPETEKESKPENGKEEDSANEETDSIDLECENLQSKLESLQMTEEDESVDILVPITENEQDDYEDDIDEGTINRYSITTLLVNFTVFTKIIENFRCFFRRRRRRRQLDHSRQFAANEKENGRRSIHRRSFHSLLHDSRLCHAKHPQANRSQCKCI